MLINLKNQQEYMEPETATLPKEEALEQADLLDGVENNAPGQDLPVGENLGGMGDSDLSVETGEKKPGTQGFYDGVPCCAFNEGEHYRLVASLPNGREVSKIVSAVDFELRFSIDPPAQGLGQSEDLLAANNPKEVMGEIDLEQPPAQTAPPTAGAANNPKEDLDEVVPDQLQTQQPLTQTATPTAGAAIGAALGDVISAPVRAALATWNAVLNASKWRQVPQDAPEQVLGKHILDGYYKNSLEGRKTQIKNIQRHIESKVTEFAELPEVAKAMTLGGQDQQAFLDKIYKAPATELTPDELAVRQKAFEIAGAQDSLVEATQSATEVFKAADKDPAWLENNMREFNDRMKQTPEALLIQDENGKKFLEKLKEMLDKIIERIKDWLFGAKGSPEAAPQAPQMQEINDDMDMALAPGR